MTTRSTSQPATGTYSWSGGDLIITPHPVDGFVVRNAGFRRRRRRLVTVLASLRLTHFRWRRVKVWPWGPFRTGKCALNFCGSKQKHWFRWFFFWLCFFFFVWNFGGAIRKLLPFFCRWFIAGWSSNKHEKRGDKKVNDLSMWNSGLLVGCKNLHHFLTAPYKEWQIDSINLAEALGWTPQACTVLHTNCLLWK